MNCMALLKNTSSGMNIRFRFEPFELDRALLALLINTLLINAHHRALCKRIDLYNNKQVTPIKKMQGNDDGYEIRCTEVKN